MEQAIKEIVDKHFTNILIDMVANEHIPFDGDVSPLGSTALEILQEDLTNNLILFNKEGR